MRTLYFDCFSGASGDMVLGALIDAGVPLGELRRALGTLAIGEDTVWADRVSRAGVTATKFCVRGEDSRWGHDQEALQHAAAGVGTHAHVHEHSHGGAHEDVQVHAHDHAHAHEHVQAHAHDHAHATHDYTHPHDHARPHDHAHGDDRAPHPSGDAAGTPAAHRVGQHHAHRSLAAINRLIEGSALSRAGKLRAKELFTTLGEAEAAIHGTSLEKVHLHEVGALDSIIDIVGTVFALEFLNAGTIVSSPLNVGSGSIRSAHGLYPVPAPATLRLLTDVPIYAGPQAAELVTPTGALLIRSYASSFGPIPPMRVRAIGYGAGSRDFADSPNVLRVLIGDADVSAPSHTVVVIEAEIDDMNPQIFGALMDQLLAQGALDVFYTPIQMKKNRPGTLLTVIAAPAERERLTATVFRETTTIGVRYRDMRRECLHRETDTVETPFGPVRVKVARRDGEMLNAAPEFDDCVQLATEHGRPVKEIQALATRAFLDKSMHR